MCPSGSDWIAQTHIPPPPASQEVQGAVRDVGDEHAAHRARPSPAIAGVVDKRPAILGRRGRGHRERHLQRLRSERVLEARGLAGSGVLVVAAPSREARGEVAGSSAGTGVARPRRSRAHADIRPNGKRRVPGAAGGVCAGEGGNEDVCGRCLPVLDSRVEAPRERAVADARLKRERGEVRRLGGVGRQRRRLEGRVDGSEV